MSIWGWMITLLLLALFISATRRWGMVAVMYCVAVAAALDFVFVTVVIIRSRPATASVFDEQNLLTLSGQTALDLIAFTIAMGFSGVLRRLDRFGASVSPAKIKPTAREDAATGKE